MNSAPNLFHLSPGDRAPEQVNAVIEVPMGSSHKFEYDEDLGIFRLDRVLYSPMHYPGDYGFVPGTYADDNDPIDVLVMMSRGTFSGAVLRARPLGYLEMADEKGSDQKILAVPVDDPRYDSTRHLDNVSRHRLREIEHFFRIYKELEGKHTQVDGWHGLEAAHELIERAMIAYRNEFAEAL